eukprot:gene19294-947_t
MPIQGKEKKGHLTEHGNGTQVRNSPRDLAKELSRIIDDSNNVEKMEQLITKMKAQGVDPIKSRSGPKPKAIPKVAITPKAVAKKASSPRATKDIESSDDELSPLKLPMPKAKPVPKRRVYDTLNDSIVSRSYD